MLDLVPGAGGGVAGVTLHVMGEGQRDGVGAVLCRAVVLATGGLGQVYSATTNPSVSTGDGMALALRAGAVLRDLEFVQFHPTVLWLGAGLDRPAAADLRGGARRGRVPRRRRRRPVHAGPARAGRPRAPRRGGQGDHAADAGERCAARVARRPALRRGDVGAALPDDPGDLPRARHRPGHRPDPGRARLPLRRPAAWRPTCTAAPPCPACSPAARWPAPGCTAPTGSPPTRCSRAWSSPGGSPPGWRPACPGGGARPPDHRAEGLVPGGRRPELQQVMTESRGCAALPRRARRRRRGARRARPDDRRRGRRGGLGDHEPAHGRPRPVGAAVQRRGDPRLPLARGLPRPRRRALVAAPRRHPRRRRSPACAPRRCPIPPPGPEETP